VTENVLVRVKLLREGAKVPHRATEHATGYDLYALPEAGSVEVGPRPVLVGTGIALEVPPGFDAQVRPRSGLARQGVLCTFGTIDPDYRGELLVALYTVGLDVRYVVKAGDRIAQLVVARVAEARFELADNLSETARGAGGHGSTGR
jgi:dUTP pyrophosphatase